MENKRDEFVKEYKVDLLPFMKKNNNSTKVSKQKEVYTSKDNKLKSVRKKMRLKKPIKRIVTIGLAGLIAFGGYKAYSEYNGYQKENTPITLDQALEMGETYESLNINKNTLKEIEETKEKINDADTTNIGLINITKDIYKLGLDIVKGKLYKVIDTKKDDIESKNEIEVLSENSGTLDTEESIYNNRTNKRLDYNLSEEMDKVIQDLGEIQTLVEVANEGEGLKRKELIKKCGSALENIEAIAAYKITCDENKNIDVKITKVKDLKENDKETGKVNTKQEIDDDEMEL